jgi:hypothetical protein
MNADQARMGITSYSRAYGILLISVNANQNGHGGLYQISISYIFPDSTQLHELKEIELMPNVAYQKAYEHFVLRHIMHIHGVVAGSEIPTMVYDHYRVVWSRAERLADNNLLYTV